MQRMHALRRGLARQVPPEGPRNRPQLDAAGFEHALFASAEAFLVSEQEREWSCLILDVHLTGMSGLGLLSRLRSKGSTVSVIVVTADASDAVRERVEEAGCVAFLAKPFRADAILGLLGSLACPTRDPSKGSSAKV
jgi:FixJ family two-component response regulator